jgi:hypothetical protein
LISHDLRKRKCFIVSINYFGGSVLEVKAAVEVKTAVEGKAAVEAKAAVEVEAPSIDLSYVCCCICCIFFSFSFFFFWRKVRPIRLRQEINAADQ